MSVVFVEGREDLAKKTAELLAGHSELHLLRVDLSAEELLGSKRGEVTLLRMDGKAEMMEEVDRLLSVRDGLRERTSEDDDAVDVDRESGADATEMPNRRSQELGRQPWGWDQAEGHADALVLHSLPHEPHGLAVLAAEEEVKP